MEFENFAKGSINVYCHNQNAIELSKNAVFYVVKRSKLKLIFISLENS